MIVNLVLELTFCIFILHSYDAMLVAMMLLVAM